ncbi:MAG: hypothetical protein Q8K24_05930 [Hydrogenophaga sp.]|nr:hypothetical protein [Hydrogenophaga sp.]
MTISLTDGTTAVTLPADLLWSDEFKGPQVGQTASRSVMGALIVQARAMTAGRPITLQPEDENSAWMRRSTVEQLRNLAAIPGAQLTLTMRGQTYSVMFRHHDGAALEADPVAHYSDAGADDFYLVTLKFMTV